MAAVEHQAELAEVEVAGRREMRGAHAGHVLQRDGQPGGALQLGEVGDRALQGGHGGRVARTGRFDVVGVHHVQQGADLGGGLEVAAMPGDRLAAHGLVGAAGLDVEAVGPVDRQPQATRQGGSAVEGRKYRMQAERVDLDHARAW